MGQIQPAKWLDLACGSMGSAACSSAWCVPLLCTTPGHQSRPLHSVPHPRAFPVALFYPCLQLLVHLLPPTAVGDRHWQQWQTGEAAAGSLGAAEGGAEKRSSAPQWDRWPTMPAGSQVVAHRSKRLITTPSREWCGVRFLSSHLHKD